MPPATADDALRPLPAGYLELYERVLRAAQDDGRVRAMWLSGSLARGVADAGSDLDVVIAVSAGSFDEFAANWREWLGRITPVVLARELPRLPGSWFSLTPECLRLDVVTLQADSAPPAALSRRLLVLDKDGTAAASAADERTAGERPGPDPNRLTAITEEFLRQQAIFPAAVVARGDWLLGVVGVQAVHTMLYELFVESNQPLPPMGVKQWSAKLTPGQRHICAGLPAPTAERSSVIAAMRTAADTFRRAAKLALAASGAAWPDELDEAVLRYQEAELGWAREPAG
jgi:predicted nucleotidyltransferase